MKTTLKLFWTQSRILCTIVLLAVIAFSMAACDSGLGGGGSGRGFTSWEALEAWLNAQPNNSRANPYLVKVNVNSTPTNVMRLNNRNKYFSLDLSGSTFISIADGAFFRCTSLTSITIPTRVISIGDFAFCLCSSLTSITIPTRVISIGESAFNECSSLASVTIPNKRKMTHFTQLQS